MELYTGKLVFEAHSDDEHLKLIEKVIGSFPEQLAVGPHFDKKGSVICGRFSDSSFDLERYKNIQVCSSECCLCKQDAVLSCDSEFLKFVRALLEINPSRRLTASNALLHSFLQ